MTEGSEYGHLVRSSTGATPAKPCPVFCTRQDAKDWHSSSNAVAAAVEYHANQIQALSVEKGLLLDSALEIEAQAYFADVDANTVPPERSLPTDFRATIDRSIANLRRAASLLSRLDAASLRMGVPAPPIPGFPRKAPKRSLELIPSVLTFAALGLLGTAVYYAARDKKPALVESETES